MATFQPVNEQLGYAFHPAEDPHDLGHPQLDVIIRPAPSGQHFDPESLACLVATTNDTTPLHVIHPWTQENHYRVCAGEIIIEDARHEQVKAFSFGGTLQIDSDARHTVCRLSSPAPLLERDRHALSLEEHLSEEVAILFAQRRAAQNDETFDRKLATVDPLQLYHTCLVALNEKFANFPATDDTHRHFKQFLSNATQSMSGEVVPTLADIL